MSRADTYAWGRYFTICRFAGVEKFGIPVEAKRNGFVLEGTYLMGKSVPRFRPLGITFWAHFTPKGLGEALRDGKGTEYYLTMLADSRSANNPLLTGETFEEWAERREDKMGSFEYNSLVRLANEMGIDTELEYIDPHLGCPSYPMCDEGPTGCLLKTKGSAVDWFGHRD